MTSIPENAVAIIGMACHFPGARDVEQYWENLRGGVESIRHFTEAELEAAGIDAALLRHPRYVKANGVLEDMEGFDAGFFGLSPRDAAVMDPQTRHFLECTWHAFEHAGHVPDAFDGTIAVFAGAGAGRYFWQNVVQDPELMEEVGYFLLRHTGNDKDFLATRASYEFNLGGPSLSIQTACSTSLVAAHYACQSLLSWECDMAVAGGVTIEQPHLTGYLYEEGEILAPDGHCRSYDHRAAGTVFGSGAGVVLLRRLADAIEDGDPIHAVIRGSAVNNDGAGKVSYLAPSVDGQVQVIAEAQLVAGVDADTIGMIEGHGTATPVGDPIEVTALTRAFRAQTEESAFCALGSVKSNIGHLDTAAGVASLIKAALAVRHGEIPPTVHFEQPNPLTELDTSPFYVNSEVLPWPAAQTPRRAGVTSLGVGGTNAHVVVEEPPAQRASSASRPWQLLTLSARSTGALEDSSRSLVDFLESHPTTPLADVSHTLRTGRKRFPHRRSLVCRTAEDVVETLATGQGGALTTHRSDAEGRDVAFLFAGGGAQYPNMGRELYESESTYREAVDLCLDHLEATEGLDLKPLLFCEPGRQEVAAAELQRPSRALPALFATQYAQARLWMSWGVEPAAMIGHSMGEYTAAALAGVFSPQDGVTLVSLRGKLFEEIDRGGMLSVSLGEEELRSRLDPSLSIAALNAPEVSVASGPVEALDALEASLSDEGIDCRRIRIDVAAHSSMLEPILPRFGEYLRTLAFSAPNIPVISNLTGEVAGEEMTTADYWVRHLRETVRFSDGVGQLLRSDGPILLEVGPGRTLATVAKMHPDWTPDQPSLNSLPHPAEPEDALSFQLGALGALWTQGVSPDWRSFEEGETRNRLPLPGYPFERSSYFVEPPRRDQETRGVPAASEDTGRRADATHWFHKTQWVPTLLPADDPAGGDACVLVLTGADGFGARLADHLETSGRRVVRVRSGAAFSESGGTYTVRAGVKDDWKALLQALGTADAMPAAAIHAWSLDAEATDHESAQDTCFFAPLLLVQALEETTPGHRLALMAMTSGAVAVSGGEVLDPYASLLLGPVRVAPKEIPTLETGLVDIGPLPKDPVQERWLFERLTAELAALGAEPVVAYRGPERWAERFATVPVEPGEPGDGLRDEGVYLITGGLGGIGLVVARELAEAGRVRLVLVGRNGLPEGDARRTWLAEHGEHDKTSRAIKEVEAIEALGSEVLVLEGDVTNPVHTKQVVNTTVDRFGALHGVFHAAGTLDDGPLLAREREQAKGVLDAKVAGTRALDDALDGVDLDFLFLFSSISAVIGAPGQVDYAAANSFMDSFARQRWHRTGQRTVALAWGAWKDVGMAAELAGETRYDRSGATLEEVITEVDHPFFDTTVATGDGERAFRTRFEPGRHWMMDEHQIRGGPWVLPGSGYVELIRAAAEDTANGGPFALRDLVFLRPFRIREQEARDLEIRFATNGEGWEVVVRGRPADTESEWVEHATAYVGDGGTASEDPEPLDSVKERVGAPAEADRPEHPVMDFGPRWANIAAQATSGSEALLRHVLPVEFRADLSSTRLHPALLDMATAGAQHLVPGMDPAKDLLVPAGYGVLDMFGPLAAEATSHVVLRSAEDDGTLASFDVTIYAPDGEAVVAVRDFSMIKIEGDVLAEPDFGDGPAWLRDAISPQEGRDVLRRVLTHATGPHVLVATRPLEALISEASSTPVRVRQAPRKTEARVLMPTVIEALEGHEAVAEAAAIGSPEGESARVVAFIVYEPGKQATVSELRRFVRGTLEKPLVPQNFVEMVSLPRDPDGTPTVEELRDPFAAVDDYVAPRTPTEEAIATIWAELLALDRVGIHDNFLDVGGHSLVGIRVLRRIQQETGVRIEANALTLQTLEQLAADVDREGGAAGASGNGDGATGSQADTLAGVGAGR